MPSDHAPMAAKVSKIGCPFQLGPNEAGEIICEWRINVQLTIERADRRPFPTLCIGSACTNWQKYHYELALRAKLSKEIEELKTQLRKEASRRNDTTDYVREAPRTPA